MFKNEGFQNFDNKNSFKKENLLNNKDLLKKLLEKREIFLKKNRPNELDFIDLYSKEEIEKDLKEISGYESQWENENKEDEFEQYIKKVASIYEMVLADQIELNDYFGGNCETFVASNFDDIKNGIDVGIIFRHNGELDELLNRAGARDQKYLGFSIDVTTASNKKVLEKKMDSIKNSIRAGNMPTLKYFEDPSTGEHKKISLPKVIVGSSLNSAEKLIELWGSNNKDKNKKLSEDPIQYGMIYQSLFQLEYFYKYAKSLSEHYEDDEKEVYLEIARSYAELYNVFYDIYEDKKELMENNLDIIKEDIVYKIIAEYTKH